MKAEELMEPLEAWHDNVHNVAESIYQRENPRLSKNKAPKRSASKKEMECKLSTLLLVLRGRCFSTYQCNQNT